MIVGAYVRVSTDGQCGDDKFGLEAQEEQIVEYCKKHDMTIIRWFKDEGESGAKERPGFDEIVYGEITNPPIEAIVVAKSDRVARDINIYFYYKMMLTKKNIQLVSVTEDFGMMGSFAPFLEAFTLCVAQMERENITKRTSGGRAIKASMGGYSGGSRPFGYKVQNGELVVDEEEATVVRYIYKRFFEGITYRALATELNNKFEVKTTHGKKWSASTLQVIVRNRPLYEGMYHYGGDDKPWVVGRQEPILGKDEFIFSKEKCTPRDYNDK